MSNQQSNCVKHQRKINQGHILNLLAKILKSSPETSQPKPTEKGTYIVKRYATYPNSNTMYGGNHESYQSSKQNNH